MSAKTMKPISISPLPRELAFMVQCPLIGTPWMRNVTAARFSKQ